MAKKRKRRRAGRCPCGSGKTYGSCCGRFHRGDAAPESAETLMRSRYAAYAKGEVDYIVETTDPEGDAWRDDTSEWRSDIRSFGRQMTFQGVDILESSEDGDRAEVLFRAKLEARGGDATFVERSQFVRRDGSWLYVSGEQERE